MTAVNYARAGIDFANHASGGSCVLSLRQAADGRRCSPFAEHQDADRPARMCNFVRSHSQRCNSCYVEVYCMGADVPHATAGS